MDGAGALLLRPRRGGRALAPDRRGLRRHGDLWQVVPAAAATFAPDHYDRCFSEELRPRRDAVLAQLESFRALGHKALEARVTVTPTAQDRPSWQRYLAHLTELCEVSVLELAEGEANTTTIAVSAAPGPECPALLAQNRGSLGRRARAHPLRSLR